MGHPSSMPVKEAFEGGLHPPATQDPRGCFDIGLNRGSMPHPPPHCVLSDRVGSLVSWGRRCVIERCDPNPGGKVPTGRLSHHHAWGTVNPPLPDGYPLSLVRKRPPHHHDPHHRVGTPVNPPLSTATPPMIPMGLSPLIPPMLF
ncbi:hypothetical protein EBZ35_05340 [bacterium]|nr:hypothetical protein [bacterium]